MGGPRPPRRTTHRRYPWTAYIPFIIMVAIPVLLIVLAVLLISRLTGASGPPATATATPSVVVAAHTATPTATQRPSPTAIATGVATVTIALGKTAKDAPLNPATVFHGAHTTLWAFAMVAPVHKGDTIRVAWRDLDHNTLIENWFQHPSADAAQFAVRMYAYLGSAATTPFPPGLYRVDIYRNADLVASSQFRVVAG